MSQRFGILIALSLGIVMGMIGGPVWIILPWGSIAVAIAFKVRRSKIFSAASFGFTASFIFMIHGYSGEQSLLSRVPPFLIIAAVGGICGSMCGLIGRKLSSKN